MHSQSYSFIIIILLIAFGIYRRVRRNIGWQPLKERRLQVRIIIFLIIGLIFLALGATHPFSLISDLVGIAIGAALGYYGIGLTRYEHRGNIWYYMPNTWIGSIVIVLFMGRLAYRLYGAYSMGAFNTNASQAASSGNMSNMSSFTNSWTSGLLLILFAYYVFYYTVLLRKQKTLSHDKISPDLMMEKK